MALLSPTGVEMGHFIRFGGKGIIRRVQAHDRALDSMPLTAITAVPYDPKSSVLLRGRYVDEANPTQILRPPEVIEGLRRHIFRITRVFDPIFAVVSVTMLLAVMLVMMLSLCLRQPAMDTMFTRGCSRWKMAERIAAELSLTAGFTVGTVYWQAECGGAGTTSEHRRYSSERSPMSAIMVNGRTYQTPQTPTVVICIDGGDPAYFHDGFERGLLPALQRFRTQGMFTTARAVVPTFTNPNNLSIVTGVPPAVHGIAGNFFLDPDSGTEVMMNEPRFLRAGSIHAALSQHGLRVAVITAKDKLRRLLGHGVQEGICFSAEKAHEAQLEEHGIDEVNALVGWDTPEVYSSQLSAFVLEAGLRVFERYQPAVMYLSLTDYIQHKHAPGTAGSDRFHRCLDAYFAAFDALGAVVGITADHGMNDKNNALGQPQIIYLRQLLSTWLGEGKARVILPITDPYVVHHGALGSFATIYLDATVHTQHVVGHLKTVAGIEYVGTRDEACRLFELPPDRVGDIVVIGDRGTALGKSPEEHDLTLLEGGLRSHGGIAEQAVLFTLNRPLTAAYRQQAAGGLRNFDIFDYALNGVEDGA